MTTKRSIRAEKARNVADTLEEDMADELALNITSLRTQHLPFLPRRLPRLPRLLAACALSAGLGFGLVNAAQAEDTIALGMTVPMSGAGASWGLGSEWVGKQAVQYVNSHGGVHVGDKTYKLALTSYDNKYTAADGVKVAQTMLNRDGIKFIILGMSTQAVVATQSISERSNVLMFTISWSNAIKGPKYPLTFTTMNTPTEFLEPLYQLVMKQHPTIRTVALISPNDSADQEVAKAATAHWEKLGAKIVGQFTYERGTTEFQPVATRAAQLKPDVIDTLGAPPGDVGVLYRALSDQGWNGVRIASAGTVSDALIHTGGKTLEGLYMGLDAVFSSSGATPIQRDLDARFQPIFHEPLNLTDLSAWDGVMALKAGLEKAGRVDATSVAKVLPTIVFDSSFGPSAFGGKSQYGTPQQILLPVIVTQVRDGKVVEIARIESTELKQRLGGK
jgi:branched-chain amino acid transport system substrate-binding protein